MAVPSIPAVPTKNPVRRLLSRSCIDPSILRLSPSSAAMRGADARSRAIVAVFRAIFTTKADLIQPPEHPRPARHSLGRAQASSHRRTDQSGVAELRLRWVTTVGGEVRLDRAGIFITARSSVV